VQKQKALAQEGRETPPTKRTLSARRSGSRPRPRRRRPSQARYQRSRNLLKQASEKQTQTAQISDSRGRALGQNVVDFEG